MFSRDYLMRQINLLVEAISRVMFFKSADQPDRALDEIDQTLRDLPGLDILLEGPLSREEVLGVCRNQSFFVSDKAVSLAELLHERAKLEPETDRSQMFLQYSVWLFDAALEDGTAALPVDILDRLHQMRSELGMRSKEK